MNVDLLNTALRVANQLDVAASKGEIVAVLYNELERQQLFGYAAGYDSAVDDHQEALWDAFAKGLEEGEEEAREPRDNAQSEGACVDPQDHPDMAAALAAKRPQFLVAEDFREGRNS